MASTSSWRFFLSFGCGGGGAAGASLGASPGGCPSEPDIKCLNWNLIVGGVVSVGVVVVMEEGKVVPKRLFGSPVESPLLTGVIWRMKMQNPALRFLVSGILVGCRKSLPPRSLLLFQPLVGGAGPS